jgi:hypothetical protein
MQARWSPSPHRRMRTTTETSGVTDTRCGALSEPNELGEVRPLTIRRLKEGARGVSAAWWLVGEALKNTCQVTDSMVQG